MSSEASTYQAFFDRLDATIVELESAREEGLVDAEAVGALSRDAADLLRRAGFVLINLMNGLAGTLPHLILPNEEPVTDTEDASGTSTEQPE